MAHDTNAKGTGLGFQMAPGASDAHAQISSKLRELYDSVRDEAIPDKFLDLLEKLDEAEQGARGAAK